MPEPYQMDASSHPALRRFSRVSLLFYLAALTMAWGYAVFQDGGRVPLHWNISLLMVGLVAVVYWLRTSQGEFAPLPDRWLSGLFLLAPAYVALQVVPLPLFLLRLLSPSRANMLDNLRPVTAAPAFASLSIDPDTTLLSVPNTRPE